jgi:integrase/recombinase XerD
VTSLADCLTQATHYWETKRSSGVMVMRAQACVDILGAKRKADKLTVSDAIHVLAGLKQRGLSQGSQASYYAAFRRMLALSGVSTIGWPSGAIPPRRSREPLDKEAVRRVYLELDAKGELETRHLLTVLQATGMRVDVEALSFTAWEPLDGKLLKVTGKGGHERTIPITSSEAWAILTDPEKANPMRRLSYSAHRKRWKKAVDRAGIASKLPTPHAIRHYYATQAYARCKDIRIVQELLGHSDIGTTARYIGADMSQLRAAVGGGEDA